MSSIEIEIKTVDGWKGVPSHVVSLGGGRFRANVRVPSEQPIADATLRFRGQIIRPLVKTTIASQRHWLDTVVIDFSTGT